MKLIFTDLDGTLLDHHNYSFDAASDALQRLKAMGVPLIICSSKTMEEIKVLQAKLGIDDPFIAENGGGLYFRMSSGFDLHFDRLAGAHWVIEMGVPRTKLRATFVEVNKDLKLHMRSFSDMTVEEVMEFTALSSEESKLAMEREYTEPFLIPEIELMRKDEIIAAFEVRGFQVLKGGRFFHLMGKFDKGDAVRKMKEIYSAQSKVALLTIGLGDSENDISMLKAVDRPVLVRKFDGTWLEIDETEEMIKTEGVGPAGWNEAVLDFLQE